MMTKTFSATLDGVEGTTVQIEAVSLNAIPQIQITGLPGEVVRESKERVSACLVHLGFDSPSSKILIHLSPASIKKIGSHYDLSIALAVLSCEKKLLGVMLDEFGFLGELSLNGRLCRVKGIIPLIEALVERPEIKKVVIPSANEFEGALMKSKKVVIADSLGDVIAALQKQIELPGCSPQAEVINQFYDNGFDEVIGQSVAKRAIQIALAGSHHLLLTGPPGVGKTMLSSCAPSLMPPLNQMEFIDVLKIYSLLGLEIDRISRDRTRPFRSPHHTISANGLLGGGAGCIVPGEASLAHRGVLFLDEFPEFRRDAIEGLREPLQSGWIHLSRVGKTVSLPSEFTLIAAMNPCPCGAYSPVESRCRCTPEKKAQYRKKLSSPILDRIGLMVVMNSHKETEHESVSNLNFKEVRDSIERVVSLQTKRGSANSLSMRSVFFKLDEQTENWLDLKKVENQLSFRRLKQVVQVARTIADLESSQNIQLGHIREAWDLRCFDFYQMS